MSQLSHSLVIKQSRHRQEFIPCLADQETAAGLPAEVVGYQHPAAGDVD